MENGNPFSPRLVPTDENRGLYSYSSPPQYHSRSKKHTPPACTRFQTSCSEIYFLQSHLNLPEILKEEKEWTEYYQEKVPAKSFKRAKTLCLSPTSKSPQYNTPARYVAHEPQDLEHYSTTRQHSKTSFASNTSFWSKFWCGANAGPDPHLHLARQHHLRRQQETAIRSISCSFVTTRAPELQDLQDTFEKEKKAEFVIVNFDDLLVVYQYPDFQHVVDLLGFRSTPLCHSFRIPRTLTQASLLAVGFEEGDVIVFDPLHGSQEISSRHNRNGQVNPSLIHAIQWVRRSSTEILVAHANGQILCYTTNIADERLPLGVQTIRKETKYKDQLLVVLNQYEYNPVQTWYITDTAIYAMAFSPDGRSLATAGRDGFLRVFDYMKQVYRATLASWFGALLCLAWSPDGKYLLTGGQDDCVSLWNWEQEELMHRYEAHHSWVNSVAFDPWECRENFYRFGSVGEDCRLVLWEYNEPLEKKKKKKMHDGVPIMSRVIHAHPTSSISFHKDTIATVCRRGSIKIWTRPTSLH